MSYLVDCRPIAGLGDGFAASFGHLQPLCLGDLHLAHRFLRRFPKRRAEFQVRNVGNVTAIVVAVKHVDVIILHSSSPSWRFCCSMISRNCLTWYGIAFPLRL